MVELNYDASGQQGMAERSALPAGEYVAAIAKAERVEAKSGNGNAYISLEFEVKDGPATGRRFWSMLNLWNSNTQAVEIAQRELTSICHATGRLRVNDTDELLGIPMIVKLGVKTDSYGEKNDVKAYKPLNGASPAPQTGQGGYQPQANTGAGQANTPPWQRRA